MRYGLLLFVFTWPAFANLCEKNFLLSFEYQNAIQRYFDGEGEILDMLGQVGAREKAYILEAMEKYPEEDVLRAVDLFKNRPELFFDEDTFNGLRFVGEIVKRDFALGSHIRAFKNKIGSGPKYNWVFPKFPPGQTVSKSDELYRSALVEVRDFLDNPAKVFQRMQEFEHEIMARARFERKDYSQMSAVDQASLKERIMQEIMSEEEIFHGFKSVSSDGYVVRELDEKEFTNESWLKMLDDGHMFHDTFFKDLDNAAYISDLNRLDHGYFTHRIQWYIVMREMSENPAKFHDFSGSQLFKKLGDVEFNRKLGMDKRGDNNLWLNMFDASDETYHSPEYFREMHTNYPEIDSWL